MSSAAVSLQIPVAPNPILAKFTLPEVSISGRGESW
jgi:hypothetical protein